MKLIVKIKPTINKKQITNKLLKSLLGYLFYL